MDNFLILENTKKDIKFDKKTNDYIYEGVFTVFDVKNNNGRIYRKDMFMPKVNSLQEKIGNKKLLGELDHPDDFHVKYSRASHIIEKLEYNESTNSVTGRIRLLDTQRGRDAKAIADAGVPLNVSSRASGRVNEAGEPIINTLYTYDLVADPGFSQAQLKSINEGITDEKCTEILTMVSEFNNNVPSNMTLVNENYNIDSTDIKIYKLNNTGMEIKTFESSKTDDSNFAKAEAIKQWSSTIVEAITELQTELQELKKTNTNSNFKSIEEKISLLETKVDVKLLAHDKYMNYLKESLEKVGDYSENYLAKQIETIGNYSENYLAKQIENIGNYSEGHLRESIEKVANYTELYLAKQIENIGNYSEGHLRESIEKVSVYCEQYLKPNLENIGNYSEGHLRESIEKIAEYSQYLKSKISTTFVETQIKENTVKKQSVDVTKSFNDFKAEMDSTLTKIIESVEKTNTDDNISENVNPEEQNVEIANKMLFDFIPETIEKEFKTLSKTGQDAIIAIAENYILDSEYKVRTFWNNQKIVENIAESRIIPKAVKQATDFASIYGFNKADLVKEFKR